MAAGGGRQAANHVYRIARPDGLTIGSMGAALVANAVLGEPGVEYDIDKLIYLGTCRQRGNIISLSLHRETGLGQHGKVAGCSQRSYRRHNRLASLFISPAVFSPM